MIRLDDVWKLYDGRPALRGATLHIDPGEAVLLCGPSGAGKTTLLRLIYLADQPDRGQIRVAGRLLSRLRRSSVPYVRRNIGVVFQDFKLMPERTVLENVAVSADVLGLPRREVLLRAQAALDTVGLTAEAERKVLGLPGGLQQRVAVARALCSEPPILLCDEPTGNLDPVRARELLEILERVRSRGTTLLIATHDPTVVAFALGQGWRKASLQEGQVVSGGLPPHELVDAGPPLAIPPERSLDLSIEIEVPPPFEDELESRP
jgi:cell division transport system ATP-binding protein